MRPLDAFGSRFGKHAAVVSFRASQRVHHVCEQTIGIKACADRLRA